MGTEKTIIETVEYRLGSTTIPKVHVAITETYIPPTISTKDRHISANPRQLTHGSIWEPLFIENELRAIKEWRSSVTDDKLRIEFLARMKKLNSYKEFCMRKRIQKNKATVGTFRNAYNDNRSHNGQEPVYLVSFRYNENGIPIKNRYLYLHWEDAQQKCIDLKVADPRFFTAEELDSMRIAVNNEDPRIKGWRIPSAKEVARLEQKYNKELYNCIYFPCGWAREDAE